MIPPFNEMDRVKYFIMFERVASTYLNEQKVSDMFKAAVLVDEYVLAHKTVFVDRGFQ